MRRLWDWVCFCWVLVRLIPRKARRDAEDKGIL